VVNWYSGNRRAAKEKRICPQVKNSAGEKTPKRVPDQRRFAKEKSPLDETGHFYKASLSKLQENSASASQDFPKFFAFLKSKQ